MDNWTELIDDLVEGRWFNQETQEMAKVPFESIVINKNLAGLEVDLLADVGFYKNLVMVCDQTTYEALGRRIKEAFKATGELDVLVLESPHADLRFVEDLRKKIAKYDGVVAVGSGTINDVCKH